MNCVFYYVLHKLIVFQIAKKIIVYVYSALEIEKINTSAKTLINSYNHKFYLDWKRNQ
jgi:hypothetical protein